MEFPGTLRNVKGSPSGSGGGESPRFSALQREPTLSDKVSSSLTESIVSGVLLPGQRLPPERELAHQFDVSRTVVREAIRSLTALGLVISKSGRGAQVSTVGPDAVSRSMSLFLRGSAGIDYETIHEVRATLETRIAALAAERATSDNIEELRRTVYQMAANEGDVVRTARLDADFHRCLAEATDNALFGVVLNSIDENLLEVRCNAFAAPGVVKYAIGAHTQILERVEAHDISGARRAMEEHLELSDRAWSAGRAKGEFAQPHQPHPSPSKPN